jgi:hypothetical protein
LAFADELARQHNAARLQLETDDCNTPAKSVYKKMGFQLIEGKEVYMKFLCAVRGGTKPNLLKSGLSTSILHIFTPSFRIY